MKEAGVGVGEGGGVDESSLRFLGFVYCGGELAGLVGVVCSMSEPYSSGTMFSTVLPEVLCASAGVGKSGSGVSACEMMRVSVMFWFG